MAPVAGPNPGDPSRRVPRVGPRLDIGGGRVPRPVPFPAAPPNIVPPPARAPSLLNDAQVEDFIYAKMTAVGRDEETVYHSLHFVNNYRGAIAGLTPTQRYLYDKSGTPNFRLWTHPNPPAGVGAVTDTNVYDVMRRLRNGESLANALQNIFAAGNPNRDKETFLNALNERGLKRLEAIAPQELYVQQGDREVRISKRVVWHCGQRVREVTQHKKLGTGRRVAYFAGSALGMGVGVPMAFEAFRDFVDATGKGFSTEKPQYQALNDGDDNAIDPELGYDTNGNLNDLKERFLQDLNNRDNPPLFKRGTDLVVNNYYKIAGHTFLYTGAGNILFAPNGNADDVVNVNFSYAISDDRETSGKPMTGADLKRSIVMMANSANELDKSARDKGFNGLSDFKALYLDDHSRQIHASREAPRLNEKPDYSNMEKLEIPFTVWQKMNGKHGQLKAESDRLEAERRQARHAPRRPEKR